MRRRGTASSKTVKAGRRKTTKVKPTSVPIAARRSHSSVVDLQEKLERQTRELEEAREEGEGVAAGGGMRRRFPRSGFGTPRSNR